MQKGINEVQMAMENMWFRRLFFFFIMPKFWGTWPNLLVRIRNWSVLTDIPIYQPNWTAQKLSRNPLEKSSWENNTVEKNIKLETLEGVEFTLDIPPELKYSETLGTGYYIEILQIDLISPRSTVIWQLYVKTLSQRI